MNPLRLKALALLFLSIIPLSIPFSYSESNADDGFVALFNGKDWDDWYLKIRSGDEEMAKKVFAIEENMIHVFDDSFPEEYNLNTKVNDTHGMAYTKKSFSKYILRFEYKWGTKVANNFGEWNYDAGCYYHIGDDKIWPSGIEYQIRYDQIKKRNHTGDLIGTDYLWFSIGEGKEATFLHPKKGGQARRAEGWMHLASTPNKYHALNGEWNQCEIVVMGSEYTIHKLNGEVVNIATDLAFSEGIIGFQSETAEIFYRNIEIKEFEEMQPMETFLN